MATISPDPALETRPEDAPVGALDEAEGPSTLPGGVPPVAQTTSRGGWVRRHRRWLVVGVVVVLALGGGLGAWLATGTGSSGPAVTVKTVVASVTTGTIKKTVAASGTIEPAQEAALNFAVSGKVTTVDVTAGQKVTAGETLATVAPTALAAQEAADQAALTAAESRLSTDESDGASSSQIASDDAAVTSAQDTLTTAEKAVADADLTSTIAGTVASVDLTVGEDVSGSGGHGAATAATTGSGAGSAQVEVISTDSYVVDSTVDDTEVGEVADGDQAVITPTGATTPVYGTVASVGQIASGSSTVASFPVTIDVTGDPSGIYAGASADISIIVKQIDDAVEVPSGAISYSTSGTATVTVVGSGGRHVTQAVTTGTTTATNDVTQITKGLRVGQKIVERELTFSGGPTARGAGTSGAGARRFFGGGTAGGGFGGFGGTSRTSSFGGFGG